MGRQRALMTLLSVLAAAAGAAAQPTVTAQTATGTATYVYSWADSTATLTPTEVTMPVSGTGATQYTASLKRTITSGKVSITGTFTVTAAAGSTGSQAITDVRVAVPGSTMQSPPQVLGCTTAPASCTFTAQWDELTARAAGGQYTVDLKVDGVAVPQASGTFTNELVETGSCATLQVALLEGQVTSSMVDITKVYATTRACESADESESITFRNLPATACSSPLSATFTGRLTDANGGTTLKDFSALTATVKATDCTGATATLGDLQTTVINSYTWDLTKTGGGSGLSTQPDAELSIPFVITATQRLTSTAGYVAGKITVQNTAGSSATISSLSVTIGGAAQTVPVSPNCASATLDAQGTTSCSFNLTNPAAPAAGTATAQVTFLSGFSVTSAAANYDYQTAGTFNIGGTATLYDVVDTTGLQTLTGQASGLGPAVIRYEPADQRPPSTAPGITLDGSRTFTYSLVVGRIMQCTDVLSVSNTATLTPQQGSTQGPTTARASASFSVVGCNVLPTIGLDFMQQWAAVTWSWAMQLTANPSMVQLNPGEGGNANFQAQFTRTRGSGTYWLSGNLRLTNPAPYPMYISSVALVSTSGQFGSLPPNCLGGGSNVGASSAPFTPANTGYGNVPVSGLSGTFFLAAGAQIDCVFNISAGTGSPLSGTVQAMASTYARYITAAGNAAYSDTYPINFAQPTQQWDIGGCLSYSVTSTTQGMAGSFSPQLSGLPNQQQICDSQTLNYAGAISPVPPTGALCNVPVTLNTQANGMALGGGTGVTGQASVQVMVVNCPAPTPSPSPTPLVPDLPPSPSPVPLVPPVVTVNPGVAAGAAGGYQWAVGISNSVGEGTGLPMTYSDTRLVRYTVTATRSAPTGSSTVSGRVTVGNTNTAPLTLTDVTVSVSTAPAPVPAQCPSPFPFDMPSGGTLVCTFSVPVPSATAGVVTASAASPAGPSAVSDGQPFSFDGLAAAGAGGAAQGKCAVLSDGVQGPPILTPQSFSVKDNRPNGNTITVCDDTTYSFTASFGPFGPNDCNSYPVTATATVTPQGGPQASSPPTAQTVFKLQPDACQAAALSVDTINVVVDPPSAVSNGSYSWTVDSVVPQYLNNVSFRETTTLGWEVKWDKVASVVSTLSGTITVSNPTPAAVTISKVEVQPELSAGAGPGGVSGVVPAVDAECEALEVPPGGSVKCQYSTTLKTGGRGFVTAEASFTGGTPITSAQAPFSFQGSDVTAPGYDACAEVTTGLMMGTALLLPGAAPAMEPTTVRACEPGSKTLTQEVGPFQEDQCGKYAVTATTRVRPLSPSQQQPFAVVTPASLTVRDCPLNVVPRPTAVIHKEFAATNVVSYAWKASVSSNVTDGVLNAPRAKRTNVSVTATARRRPGVRSVSISGAVRLMGQGKSALSVAKVQAAAQSRTGKLIVVDAVCPPSSIKGGLIRIPPPTATVLCTFNITNLPPTDGAVEALVFVKEGSQTPLPTDPYVFRLADAGRDVQGDCVQVGTSRSLTRRGGAGGGSAKAAAVVQPARSGAGIPATPVCKTASETYTLTFGPYKEDQCGAYDFTSDLSADLTNSPKWENAQLSFKVNVVC